MKTTCLTSLLRSEGGGGYEGNRMMVGIVGPSQRLPVGLRLVGLNVAFLCARRMVRWLDGYHIRSPFVNLCRACNLTSSSPCLTGPVDYLYASCHKGRGFKSPRGYLCGTGNFLLAMSHYKPVILHRSACLCTF